MEKSTSHYNGKMTLPVLAISSGLLPAFPLLSVPTIQSEFPALSSEHRFKEYVP